jgi:hypothetical protein
VGVNLRQRQKCRILQPDWMNIDTIEELKEAEKESPGKACFLNPLSFKTILLSCNLIVFFNQLSFNPVIKLVGCSEPPKDFKLTLSIENFITTTNQLKF